MFRHISKLGLRLFAVVAALAVAAMIAAPAQAASGPLARVVLNGQPANADYAVSVTDKGTVSATFLGTTYPCASANGSGTFRSTDPFNNPYLILTTVNIANCSGPAGTTINVTLSPGCRLVVGATTGQTVDDALVDHNVTGTMSLLDASNNPCTLRANGGALCQMQIGGSVAASFDEDKGSGVQNLHIGGTGLTITSATGLCAFVVGASIDFNLDFNVSAGSPGDKINFKP